MPEFSFVPKPYKKEPIMVRVTNEKLVAIDRMAGKYNISRSEFVNQCIDFALKHMPAEEHENTK